MSERQCEPKEIEKCLFFFFSTFKFYRIPIFVSRPFAYARQPRRILIVRTRTNFTDCTNTVNSLKCKHVFINLQRRAAGSGNTVSRFVWCFFHRERGKSRVKKIRRFSSGHTKIIQNNAHSNSPIKIYSIRMFRIRRNHKNIVPNDFRIKPFSFSNDYYRL